MKIVLDCANGATYKVAPIIFAELGAEIIAIHDQPDGLNINRACGSQHTDDLRRKVKETGADVGLAFDGDGDRMLPVDEKGNELTGDHVLAICAKMMKDRGQLKGDLLVSTVMANFGFYVAMKRLGIRCATAQVGDRYVLEMMRAEGAVLGGEASGHVIFHQHHTTGDGILSALQLLSAMRTSRKPLSELAGVMSLTPQKLQNIPVKQKPPLENLSELQKAIRAAEAELKDQGRVLVRYSGTQSLCRVMVEGPTQELTERLTASLSETVRRCIG
jgi:phosphoglucosamine mutase